MAKVEIENLQGKAQNYEGKNGVLKGKVDVCNIEIRVLKSVIQIHGLYEFADICIPVQVSYKGNSDSPVHVGGKENIDSHLGDEKMQKYSGNDDGNKDI